MNKLFLCTTIIVLFLAGSIHAETLKGKVLWIYDGDTIKVEKLGKIRLIGIDTPEYKASSRDRFYTKKFKTKPQRLRKIAKQAKKFNIQQVKGRQVELKFDKHKKDKYDRLLAYVYLPNGDMLNEVLLKKGLATVFRRYNFRYKKEFLRLETKAQKNKLGLWQK